MAPKKPDKGLWSSLAYRLDGPELVRLVTGAWFPERLMAWAVYDDGPSVAMYFLVEEGRVVLYGVNIGGRPQRPRRAHRPLVTPSLVHGLPLGHIVEWTKEQIAEMTERDVKGGL